MYMRFVHLRVKPEKMAGFETFVRRVLHAASLPKRPLTIVVRCSISYFIKRAKKVAPLPSLTMLRTSVAHILFVRITAP